MPYTALCPAPLRELLEDISEEWQNLMWQCSPERQEVASLRLAAHEKAMKEGYQSPYTDPDDFNINWEPIVKRLK